MTIDDIIAAFRSVQTDIANNMRTESPFYTPESAQERIDFIESFLSRVKKNLAASSYLSRWGISKPDEWDQIMEDAFTELNILCRDEDKYARAANEFWNVLSKGL